MYHGSKGGAFQKFICNLLLNAHPICIARFMHPICTKTIHKFYLTYLTVFSEYEIPNIVPENINNALYDISDQYYVENINNTVINATIRNNLIIVTWCLKNGADVRYRNDMAVRYAAELGYFKIVKLLLAAGADIHAREDYALRHAVKHRHLDVVQFLLENNKFSIIAIIAARNMEYYHGYYAKMTKLLDSYKDV